MPFICAFCKFDIQAGELVQPDVAMNLAHRTCVEKELESLKLTPAAVPATPPPLPPSPEYVSPARPSVCAECGDKAISMCPSCRTLVCQSYGWNGKTCSIAHEGKCSGARTSREPLQKPLAMKLVPIFDTMPVRVVRNGRHKQKPRRRDRR